MNTAPYPFVLRLISTWSHMESETLHAGNKQITQEEVKNWLLQLLFEVFLFKGTPSPGH